MKWSFITKIEADDLTSFLLCLCCVTKIWSMYCERLATPDGFHVHGFQKIRLLLHTVSGLMEPLDPNVS